MTEEQVKALMRDWRDQIEHSVSGSRERSLALTKLEECEMWWLKAIQVYADEVV